jgi:transglutaminase-like putative cysteine protease
VSGVKKSLLVMGLTVLFSVLILSVLFNNFQLYILSLPRVRPTEQGKSTSQEHQPVLDFPDLFPIEPPQLLFTVSPAQPALYWRAYTADFYTGFGWRKTTTEEIVDDFSETATGGRTQIFSVRLNTTSAKIVLPVPPSETNVTRPFMAPSVPFHLTQDEVADSYGVILGEPFQPFVNNVSVIYQASYHFKQIDKELVSLVNLPNDTKSVYLQLPKLPDEVAELANDLRDVSLNPVDQVLRDIQFFLTNFEYDINFKEGKTVRVIQQDWAASYLKLRKGICTDANTALAVILRLQGIPARITVGFKPARILNDKVYYYSDHAHAETEAYLPPFGWVRFDATPPNTDLQETPHLGWSGQRGYLYPKAKSKLNLQVVPKNATGYPGDSILYRASINNSRLSKDVFKLETYSDRGWGVEVVSGNLEIEPFEVGETLIKVNVPSDAVEPDYDIITVAATSTLEPDLWASATATANVKGIEKTSTSLQISGPDTATSGSVVQFEVSLSDDKGRPIEQQEISVETYGISLKTDSSGIATFSVDEASFWWRSFLLEASFKGSNLYQASSAFTSVSVGPHMISFLLPSLFSCLVVSMYIAQTRRLRLRKRRTPIKRKETVHVRDLESQDAAKKKPLLNIIFPHIQKPFPNVWGVNEEISIRCVFDGDEKQTLPNGNIEILVDRNKLAECPLRRDCSADVTYTFEEKGERAVSAIFKDESEKVRDIAQKNVQIVDYKEEIVRLYNGFLQRLAQEDFELKEAMTAREVQSQILRRSSFKPHNVRDIIECFEQAEYSDHSIMRKNYKTMYLAIRRLPLNDS